jgi:hypothetical protein
LPVVLIEKKRYKAGIMKKLRDVREYSKESMRKEEMVNNTRKNSKKIINSKKV